MSYSGYSYYRFHKTNTDINGIGDIKYKEVPMQKLGALTAEKACLGHLHHCWGGVEIKITHLSFAVTPAHQWFCHCRAADVEQDSDKVVSTAGVSPTILPHSEKTLKSLSEATSAPSPRGKSGWHSHFVHLWPWKITALIIQTVKLDSSFIRLALICLPCRELLPFIHDTYTSFLNCKL